MFALLVLCTLFVIVMYLLISHQRRTMAKDAELLTLAIASEDKYLKKMRKVT